MRDWKERLTGQLEAVLRGADPRPNISAYHDMPYAIFQYPPEDEFEVRQEITLLRTRLEQAGKRVTVISLAECLRSALDAEGMGTDALVDAEKSVGLEPTIETIHQVISEYQPLDELVAKRIPSDADPLRDVVFIVRAGSLFRSTGPRPCSSSSRGGSTYLRCSATRASSTAPQDSGSWESSTQSITTGRRSSERAGGREG